MLIHSIAGHQNALDTSDMDVGWSLRFGGLTNIKSNKNTHQKCILASKTPTSRGILA
jgi:hypothetical protein